MKFYKIIIFLVATVLLQNTAAAEIQTRIVGGNESALSEWPWMVLLSPTDSNSDFFCGGSLINKNWVLTAAHCVVDISSELHAFVGEYKKSNGSIIPNQVTKIIIHPDYNPFTSDNDLALLRLTNVETITPVNIISSNIAATLESRSSDFVDDVVAIGWGGTLNDSGEEGDEFKQTKPDVLRDVNLPYISNTSCNESSFLKGQVTDNMMCAGHPDGGVDSCQGDSGGPLVFYEAGSWHQAGIVSFGYGCAVAGSYGVYTRVENYIDWIEYAQVITPTVNFGTWVAGKAISRQIVVDNDSDLAFNINDIVSNNSSVFSVGTNTCVNPINIGDRCTINISFIASNSGAYNSIINIDTSHPNLQTVPVAVNGIITARKVFNNVDADNSIEWALGGDQNWLEARVTNDAGSSLQSGKVYDNQKSSLFAYINVAEGTSLEQRKVFFDWKVCSEPFFDYLQLWVDGVKKTSVAGDTDWASYIVTLAGIGDHVIEWRYKKDYEHFNGDDSAWLDNIELDSASTNTLPIQIKSCDLAIEGDSVVPAVKMSSATMSPWLLLGLGLPLILRRRIRLSV